MARWWLFVFVLTAVAGTAVAAGPTQMRTWYDTNGTQFYGRAIETDGTSVVFEGRDGRRVTVGLYDLSRQDRLIIEEHFGLGSETDEGLEYYPAIEQPEEDMVPARRSPLVLVAIVIGFNVSGVGLIWFLITAFRQSIGWGLAVLLIPGASLIFLVVHWDHAKRPFLVALLGAAIVRGTSYLAGA